ncbi:MAG: hypothetical protein HYY18_10085 [Planctomycetes bacterium]|nr:hypothetical protein [Planctomycetota bacterium]
MRLGSLEAILTALNRRRTRYLIVGGLAVAAHGYGRATFDVDLVVQLKPENVRRALAGLATLGYRPLVPVPARDFADPGLRRRWIREKNMIVFQLHSDQHRETRVDLFVREPFRFDSEYDRALEGEVFPGVRTRFVRLETLLRMKKKAGREKDLEDLRQLESLRRKRRDR